MILIKLRTKSAVLRAEQSARYSRTLGRISNAEATTKLERINGREIRGKKKYIYNMERIHQLQGEQEM